MVSAQSIHTKLRRSCRPRLRLWLVAVVLGCANGWAFCAQGPACCAQGPTCVLYLDSYHPGNLWSRSIQQGIREVLCKEGEVDLRTEYLDTKYIFSPDYSRRLADLYARKYAGKTFQAILVSDNNALDFMLEYRDRLFPGVPVVFCGVNNFSPAMLQGRRGYTGVVETIDMVETLQLAQRLFPQARRLVVITSKTNSGQANKQLFLRSARKMSLSLPYTILEDWELEGLLDTVASLPENTIILRLGLNLGGNGHPLEEWTALRRLSERSNAPIFTCWEHILGTGLLGGKVVSGWRQGQEAARLVQRVLAGEPLDAIPVVTESPNRIAFDERALHRFSIDPEILPAGAHLLFPRPTFYQRHKRVLHASGIAVGLMVFVILILLAYLIRRRQALRRLRERESHWRTLYEGLPGNSFIVNEYGRLEDVNDAMCQLTGYSREELLGQSCQVLCAQAMETCPIRNRDVDRFVNAEGVIRTQDGRDIPMLRSARRISLAGRDVVIESVQDITTRKEAEEVLRRSEGTERALRENLSLLHEVIIALTAERDWKSLCRRTVELAHKKLGFDRMGIWFKGNPPNFVCGSYGVDEKGRLRDERSQRLSITDDLMLSRAMKASSPTTFCTTRELRDDHGAIVGEGTNAVTTLWNGEEVIGYISADSLLSGRSIPPVQQRILTLLAATLANLLTGLNAEKERRRLASAIEQASEAIVITSDDGTVEYVNQGLTKMLDYQADQVLGQKMSLFYNHHNETDTMAGMQEAMTEGRTWLKRMAVRKKGGETIDVEVNLSPVRSEEGQITHFVHILRDLSKEAQLEAQLRQAAKMEAIGRLAGGIAHDFNNQLTVVRGYCDLLLRDLQEDSPVRECIEEIDHATRQASTLTSELLSFSRKQILKPQVVNPNQILQNIRNSLGLVGEDIRLELELPSDVGNIRVDPNRLEQAVMNLAINARDAMPDGGRLVIRTADVENNGIVPIPTCPGGPIPMVMISVEDDGFGMDSRVAEQIFEPFFSTKEKGKGTGLGLSMVYGFVQQSQGHIDVTSQPGQGTCFRIFLPRVEEAIDVEVSAPELSPVTGGRETILVVEDDSSVRQLVVRVLRGNGYTVMQTGVPEEAPGLMAQADGKVDLVISDVVMPGTSGPTLVRMLHQRQKNLRVLFISGFTDEKTLRREIQFDEVNFLQKPFSPEDLLHAVIRALGEKG